MSGSAGLFNNFFIFFYLVGSPKVGGAGDGKHKKKYGHPNRDNGTYGHNHIPGVEITNGPVVHDQQKMSRTI